MAEDREKEVDQKIEGYLDQLTRVTTLDDLLRLVRDAAGWALSEHRKDMERRER